MENQTSHDVHMKEVHPPLISLAHTATSIDRRLAPAPPAITVTTKSPTIENISIKPGLTVSPILSASTNNLTPSPGDGHRMMMISPAISPGDDDKKPRPFVCNVCASSFSRQHDLKRHKRLHDGSKPYKCPHCARNFSRQDALSRHLKVDGNGAPCCGFRKPSYRPEDSPKKRLEGDTEEHEEGTSQEVIYLRKQVFTLSEENRILKSKLEDLNKTFSKKVDDLEAQIKALEIEKTLLRGIVIDASKKAEQ